MTTCRSTFCVKQLGRADCFLFPSNLHTREERIRTVQDLRTNHAQRTQRYRSIPRMFHKIYGTMLSIPLSTGCTCGSTSQSKRGDMMRLHKNHCLQQRKRAEFATANQMNGSCSKENRNSAKKLSTCYVTKITEHMGTRNTCAPKARTNAF